jgi:hypothetical protein
MVGFNGEEPVIVSNHSEGNSVGLRQTFTMPLGSLRLPWEPPPLLIKA